MREQSSSTSSSAFVTRSFVPPPRCPLLLVDLTNTCFKVFDQGISHANDRLDSSISNRFHIQPHGNITSRSIFSRVIQVNATYNGQLRLGILVEWFVKGNGILESTCIPR